MTDRVELAEAIHEAEHGLCNCDYLDQSYLDQADDLLPWLTQHDAELVAEVEHWKAHAEEAGAGFSRVCKDYARVSARNTALTSERDALAAKVADAESRPSIVLRNKFLYSDGPDAEDCICCAGPHCFGRGAEVIESQFATGYDHLDDAQGHMGRAVASFGDGAEVAVTFNLRTALTGATP